MYRLVASYFTHRFDLLESKIKKRVLTNSVRLSPSPINHSMQSSAIGIQTEIFIRPSATVSIDMDDRTIDGQRSLRTVVSAKVLETFHGITGYEDGGMKMT